MATTDLIGAPERADHPATVPVMPEDDRRAHELASYVRPTAPLASPGDVYVAAARADHLTHCTPCRERADAIDAAIAANGESMARRDRIQLGLRIAGTKAVTA